MAQPKPEDKATLDQILKLVDQLTPDEQVQLVDEVKLQWLQHELQKGIDQADQGEVVDGEAVFKQMRERNAAMRQKGNQ